MRHGPSDASIYQRPRWFLGKGAARRDLVRYNRWVFDEAAIPDVHVFRAAEYLAALYFSEKLMEVVFRPSQPSKIWAFLSTAVTRESHMIRPELGQEKGHRKGVRNRYCQA